MGVLVPTCWMLLLSLTMVTRAARLLNDWSREELKKELRGLELEANFESLEDDLELAERLVHQWEDTDKKCTSKHLPDIPNVELKCRLSGCRGTCISGYELPGGITRFTLLCDEETGQLTYHDEPFRETLPECQPICGSGCQNGGTCTEPGKCSCPVAFEGDLCETKISCPDPGLQILNGVAEVASLSLKFTCSDGFEMTTADVERSFQCQGGAWPIANILPLVDADTGVIICRPRCSPECHNGGVCTGPGRCSCPRGFWGPRCDVQRCTMPKQVIPHTSMGGTLSRLSIKCHTGFTMHGGATGMQVQCHKGKWMMPDHKTPFTNDMAHCEPMCQSGCQNGGTCVEPDKCKCPPGFTGSTCQNT